MQGLVTTNIGGMIRQLLFALIVVGLTFSVSAKGVMAAGGEGQNVDFRWSFGALTGTGKDRRFQTITQDTVLKSGDQFKMMVELQKECFVYVIHHNAQDEVTMLFPYNLKQFETDYKTAKKYYIPQGESWFELDKHVGREAFYLLASGERLSRLESLFSEYESSDPAKKPEAKQQIVDEIRSLKKQHRELAAPAERPVTIGGTIRSLEKNQGLNRPDLAAVSDEIQSDGFVARTFTIEHQ